MKPLATGAYATGFILITLGIGIFSGFIPFSVSASSVSVDCSAWPTNCTATAPVTNSGTVGFTAPFTAYFVYQNTLSQTVLIDQVAWTSAQLSVSDSGFTPAKVPGAGSTLLGFSVNVFFWDANGAPMGASTSQSFSVPQKFEITYAGVGSISVSPPGSSPNSGGTTSGIYTAYWPVGTALTITTSAGVAPVTSIPAGLCSASASGSGFTCTWTVSNSVNVIAISGGASASQNVILVYQVTGGSAVTPQEVCLSATATSLTTPSLQCGPTQTFAVNPPAAWSVQQQNSGTVLQSGFGGSVSLNYADFASKVTFSGGIASLNFVTQMPVTLIINQEPLGNGAYAQTTPASGTYVCTPTGTVCQPGQSVSLSVVVPSGYQFQGWIINGQNVGTANPYSVSIPQAGTVAVQPVLESCPAGTNCPGGGGGGGGGGLSGAQSIGLVLALAGIGSLVVGAVEDRKEDE